MYIKDVFYMPENEFSINEDSLATIHNIRQLAEIILQKLTVLEGSVANIAGITGIDCGEITVSNSGKPSSAAIANNKLFSDEDMGQFTSSISASIRAGTFENIVPGRYFDFSNVAYTYLDENDTTQNDTYTGRMRIMHLDYPQCCGNTSFPAHNIVVVPDESMFLAKMNDTNTTEGGYVGSKMRTKHLRRAEAIFKACFGADHVLTYAEYLVSAVTDGKPSSCIECSCTVELMSVKMVLDWNVHQLSNMLEHVQLAAFQQNDALKNNEESNYWLRDVAGTIDFSSIANGGYQGNYASSYVFGIRPFAFIY